MLTDEQVTLITAAVDGELSPAETLRFRRLLDTSSEARTLYVRLKDDSTRLCNFPSTTPPKNLLVRVMARIAAPHADSRHAHRPRDRESATGGLTASSDCPRHHPDHAVTADDPSLGTGSNRSQHHVRLHGRFVLVLHPRRQDG